ncbi:MAG TPA: type II toxin-antitoxin system HicA family toxin [Ktedonobacterales bacterium]
MPNQSSSREILAVLRQVGFVEVSQRGSHLKLRRQRDGRTLTVIVKHPAASIPVGTFRAILRQAELTLDEFKRLLD